MTSPVYDRLLSEIDDDLERKVLTVLLNQAGQRISRQGLIRSIFNVYVAPDKLAASTEDRQIRECIDRLREQDWPILSSSSQAGYVLEYNETAVYKFAAEQQSRSEHARETARHAYASIGKARAIQEAVRTQTVVTQERLIP
jgi:hypothetical protein